MFGNIAHLRPFSLTMRYSMSTSIPHSFAGLCIPSIMRSWEIYQFGDTNQLSQSTTTRTPCLQTPDDVLVEVRASSVNPMDVMMLAGYGANSLSIPRQCLMQDHHFPLTLGRDFSGIVRDLGYGAQAKGFLLGQEVFGAVWPWEAGCHSEYVTVSGDRVAEKPGNLSHSEAACLGYAGQTAFVALREFGGLRGGPEGSKGKRVLVAGASGGVGTVAVQLAIAWGAHVTCTCPPGALDWMQNLGASEVLSSDRESELGGGGAEYHLILDLIGREEQLFPLLHSSVCSRYVSLTSPLIGHLDRYGTIPGLGFSVTTLMAKSARQLMSGCRGYSWAFFRPSSSNLLEMASLSTRGLLKPVIGLEVDFSQVDEAFRWVHGRGKKGKAVIRVGS